MNKFTSIRGAMQLAISLVAILLSVVLISSLTSLQSASGQLEVGDLEITPLLLAPMVVSDDSVYVVWLSNKTGNWEVMIRVSNDNGATFGPMLALATNGTIGEAEGTEEVE